MQSVQLVHYVCSHQFWCSCTFLPTACSRLNYLYKYAMEITDIIYNAWIPIIYNH